MSQDRKQLGFTLIELMLAMAFVSILLLAITMTVIQISSIFNRGLTLKEVNQAGRAMVDSVQDTIASSSPFDLSTKYIKQDWGGRLCLGQYSYIWNYGTAIDDAGYNRDFTNVYEDGPKQNVRIRFVKVFDNGGAYCKKTPSLPKIKFADSLELLDAGEHDLAMHSFSINSYGTASDSVTNQRLYSISFVIGTNKIDAINDAKTACKAPGEPKSDISYCAVTRFDIMALSGNSIQ